MYENPLAGTAPTVAQQIQSQRSKVNNLTEQRNTATFELGELRNQPNPDPQRAAQLRASVERLDASIRDERDTLTELRSIQADDDRHDTVSRRTFAAAEQPAGGDGEYRFDGAGYVFHSSDGRGGFRTDSRSRTYTERNQGEFLRDLFALSTGQLRGEGISRLDKHEAEARAAGQFSERAGTTSAFAGVIPPQYLIDQYALVARAGRPAANLAQHLPLPSDGMSLVIPRGTTGTSVAVQAAENTALSSTDEAWTNLTVPVVTAGGYNDISRQAIERSQGVDQIVFGDLVAAYAVAVDQQVLSGTGAAGQALGILNTSGINQAAAFTAAATVQTFYSRIAGQLNAIETGRYFAPNVIIMHPRRWNWLISQLDSSQRPLVVPNGSGPMNAYGTTEAPVDSASIAPVGQLYGLPVITDPSIPTNVGSGPEDVVIIARREDLLLWEDPQAPFTLKFEQPVGQQLTVRLVAYGYFAFTAGRYPTAVGIVGGNSAAGFGLGSVTF